MSDVTQPTPVSPDDHLDRATSRRLSRLRSLPVETARLDRSINGQIPRDSEPSIRAVWRPRALRWAAAALVMLAVGVGIFVAANGQQASASPAHMAQVHQDLLAGRIPAEKVDSIDAANRLLAGADSGFPTLPEVPAEHVMACCLREVKDRKVAFVLLEADGVPLTLAVARADEFKSQGSKTVTQNGVRYHLQSHKGINMVMKESSGRFICLMGELPSDRLVELCGELKS